MDTVGGFMRGPGAPDPMATLFRIIQSPEDVKAELQRLQEAMVANDARKAAAETAEANARTAIEALAVKQTQHDMRQAQLDKDNQDLADRTLQFNEQTRRTQADLDDQFSGLRAQQEALKRDRAQLVSDNAIADQREAAQNDRLAALDARHAELDQRESGIAIREGAANDAKAVFEAKMQAIKAAAGA